MLANRSFEPACQMGMGGNVNPWTESCCGVKEGPKLIYLNRFVRKPKEYVS